jgi:hypothetical protein
MLIDVHYRKYTKLYPYPYAHAKSACSYVVTSAKNQICIYPQFPQDYVSLAPSTPDVPMYRTYVPQKNNLKTPPNHVRRKSNTIIA